ncbi:MAG: hypothetical protein AB7I13_16880 [Vicinamibacterales bacterium]
MTSREIEEYRALRDTIRERSTARVWIAFAGFAAWAALSTVIAIWTELPIATLVPLLVLLATFEIVFALHVGVERVGRYIQVFFEDEQADRGWEHQAMEFGRRFPGGGIDPLFSVQFWWAIVLNLIPAALAAPAAIEWLVVGTAHAIAILRIVNGRRYARTQRASDLDHFRTLKAGSPPAAHP